MNYRRCGSLLLEPREQVHFELARVLQGGDGVVMQIQWFALAPHLDAPVVVNAQEREQLGLLSPTTWLPGPLSAVQQGLFDKGLIVAAASSVDDPGDRDARLRGGHWWTPAALMHRAGRWQGVDSASDMEANRLFTAADLRGQLGAPPPATVPRGKLGEMVTLPEAPAREIRSAARRATCRNFDADRAISADMLSALLAATVMAHGQVHAGQDMTFLKKAVPSGGGLHANEAYLLVQRVEGVGAGLYHYRPLDHALAPLPAREGALGALAGRMLAGQHWFADAAVLVVLAPRYARGFWKYRNHAKAYRALLLDIGHLSQAFYTQATALGLGAFVTSAINEVDIEQALGLDPFEEGPLAICGFGWRGERMRNPELDPNGAVWPAAQAAAGPPPA